MEIMRASLARHVKLAVLATVIAGVVLTVGAWAAVVRTERSDTDRCPSRSGASVDGIALAWGEPDECAYVDDTTGEPAYPDGRLAGPVDTTPFSTAAALGTLPTLLVTGALVASERSQRRRSRIAT